ncbi:MAG TPA: VanZ family protein [Thermoanaerobaculia bacterium]|nr:VanZ family protein [Thermoanaerobaculia bacterium]
MRAEPFRYWLPAILWAAVILSFSGEGGGSGTTAGWLVLLFGDLRPDALFYIHYTLRKGAHVVAYAILGALNLRAIRGGRPGRRPICVVAAVLLATAVAAIDELHQATSATRTGSLADIGFDFCGAVLGVMLIRKSRPDPE